MRPLSALPTSCYVMNPLQVSTVWNDSALTSYQFGSNMPKRVFLIGLLFIILGLSEVVKVLFGLWQDKFIWNFNVLMAPVGVGLLLGKSSSRWWAQFWIIFLYVGLAIMLCNTVSQPDHIRFTWFSNPVQFASPQLYLLIIEIVYALLLISVHVLLYSKKSNNYFHACAARKNRTTL